MKQPINQKKKNPKKTKKQIFWSSPFPSEDFTHVLLQLHL